jgi:hypothetical protein
MICIVEKAQATEKSVTRANNFVVYFGMDDSGGAYTATDLRTLADELDRRNAAWQASIRAYFEKAPPTYFEKAPRT